MTLGVGATLAADTRGVESLRAAAARDPRAAIKEAAKQFEALFMHELMKSMRQATPSSGLLDNEASQLGTEMLDTQFAQQMTGLRGGLSEAIARHLERQLGVAVQPAGAVVRDLDAESLSVPLPLPLPLGEGRGEGRPPPVVRGAPSLTPTLSREREREQTSVPPAVELSPTQASFVQQHAPAARAAQHSSGIPAHFMLAQAAHETGWGRSEIRNADGSSAHNLFGIKAGPNWKGAVATALTTEFIDGQPHKVQAKFRAYASAADSFADYARLIGDNPRYAAAREVLAQSGSAQDGSTQRFATELQRAGYATDPAYADKLTRTINTLLRAQRALA
jgi:peptidoglycan hydrolase FlgJ